MADGEKKKGSDCGPVKTTAEEYQAQQTFFSKKVPPQELAGFTLSGGQKSAYYFYMGNECNLPYVKVEGAGGIAKEFGWNEVIEVPPGVTLKVRNVSKHTGDIHIQSGKVPTPGPKRVSIPISFYYAGDNGTLAYFVSNQYIDTRRAVRAWHVFDPVFTGADNTGIVGVMAFYEQHTANPEQYTILPTLPDASWFMDLQMPINTFFNTIPLGQQFVLAGFESMATMQLPDFARTIIGVDLTLGTDPPVNAFALIEY